MFRLLSVCLAIAGVAAGCANDLTPTTPTPVDPVTVTETFGGTLTQNGGVTHLFVADRAGTVTATLTTVAPDSAATIGLSLGIWNSFTSACTVVIAKDNAVQGSTVLGQATAPGQLCVRLYDVGVLAEPASYEVTVIHP